MKKGGYIALGAFLLAIVLFICGTMINGFSELEALYNKGDLAVNVPWLKGSDKTMEFEGIKNLDIQAEAGTIEFSEYDGSTIKVEAKNISQKTTIVQEDKTLVIEDSSRLGYLIGRSNLKTKIKIYVPYDYEFVKVELEVDAGQMQATNLKAQNLEIDVDAGKFTADHLISAYSKVEVDAGEIKIGLLDSENSEFNCDAGNIEVTMSGNESDYSYEADVAVGDITIGSYRCDGLSDEHNHHGGPRKIVADCDVGSIKIKMEG